MLSNTWERRPGDKINEREEKMEEEERGIGHRNLV